MSYIGHTCACGHPDIYHAKPGLCESCRPGGKAATSLPLLRPCGAPGPSEVRLPFRGNRVVEEIYPPGAEIVWTRAGHRSLTCDCGDCQLLYAEVTA